MHRALRNIRDKFVHIKDILNSTYDKITELHDPKTRDKYRGVPSRFRDLDHILTGFQPSDLIILAARPSMGKTALALNIAQNVAKTGRSVGLNSLEMSKEQLVERMFSSLLSVDSWKIKAGKFLRCGKQNLYAGRKRCSFPTQPGFFGGWSAAPSINPT